MPHIPLEEHLPGVTGLLEYSRATSTPLRELTQVLLRGPSTLTETERELIATVVSHGNDCKYCSSSHAAAVVALSGDDDLAACVRKDISTAPVSEKMKALLQVAALVRVSGKAVTPESIAAAKLNGATDREIHDTVLIAALFCLYNRYVDGLATVAPDDPEYYAGLGTRLREHGYYRLPQGYDHLKSQS